MDRTYIYSDSNLGAWNGPPETGRVKGPRCHDSGLLLSAKVCAVACSVMALSTCTSRVSICRRPPGGTPALCTLEPRRWDAGGSSSPIVFGASHPAVHRRRTTPYGLVHSSRYPNCTGTSFCLDIWSIYIMQCSSTSDQVPGALERHGYQSNGRAVQARRR